VRALFDARDSAAYRPSVGPGASTEAKCASAICAVLFDEGQGVHYGTEATARAEHIGFRFGVERVSVGRKCRGVECAAVGVKDPDVFVMALVCVGGGDHGRVYRGERSPV